MSRPKKPGPGGRRVGAGAKPRSSLGTGVKVGIVLAPQVVAWLDARGVRGAEARGIIEREYLRSQPPPGPN